MTNPIRKAAYSIRDAVRTQLWPIPVLGIIIAVAAGILLPSLDALVDGTLPAWLDAVVFGGDAGAARTVLDAVASSLITVTSLTFSLTVVTLQLASSQFSPRLLRTFTRDLFVQVTLAIFLATFTYSLTVLRAVRSSAESSEPFVPRIAVTLSFLLALSSVIGLVLFLAHLTRQIRVETMLVNVHTDATGSMKANLTRRDDPDHPEGPDAAPPSPDAVPILARRSGFCVGLDDDDLLKAARAQDAFIRIDCSPGAFLVAGTPVGMVWRQDGSRLTDDEGDALAAGVDDALRLGSERTGAQDVGYGLRQMVDVATKALSPGINDPTTAVHALNHISALLSELSAYRLGSFALADEDAIPRVELVRPSFDDHLDVALTQPRRYGGGDSLVVSRLLRILRDLAWTAPSEYAPAVRRQLDRLQETTAAEDFDATERAEQERLAMEIRKALAR